MTVVHTTERVAVHLKLDRPVRQEVIGNLHRKGLTLQEFFEDLMEALAADPDRIADIRIIAATRPRRTAAATI